MGAFPLPHVLNGRWRLDAVVGRGGGSSVYRATDLESGAEVAVKLAEPWRSGAKLAERFAREAAALAIVGGPHVVRLHAEGRAEGLGLPFLVMERLVGHDLAQELKLRGAIPPAEAARWLEQAAEALELAHGVGIVHRDLKPSNLFLHEAGGERILKILDFGLVKQLDPDATAGDRDATAGTPAYMAPEQVLGQGARTGPATDIWAMGMVALTVLTGERYWRAQTVAATLEAIRHEPLAPPSRRWPWLGPAFDAWFRRSCDRLPERRFRRAAQQAEALRRALAAVGPPQPLPRAPRDDELTLSRSATIADETGAAPAADAQAARLLARAIGRDAELRELAALLVSGGVVTVTGPAGAGKTHLARALAARLEERFERGAWFVPLAGLRDAAQVPDAVVEALGAARDPLRDAGAQLADLVGAGRALLILDNVEHLGAARAEVAALRASCPRATWLLTGRAPLGLDGEVRYELAPLAVPPPARVTRGADAAQYSGVQLFVERARQRLPGFELTDDNAAQVVEICRRVEGLPLGIELAAARLESHDPVEIQAGLDPAGDAHEPARVLRDTVAWSHDLLPPAARVLFRRLAVHPGSTSLAAARALVDGDAGPALAALEASSLIAHTTDEPPRLTMLQTVRGFAAEALAAAGEVELAQRRALAHALAVTASADEALRGPGQHAALDALAADHDNLLAALDWATGGDPAGALELAARLSWFWYLGGHYRDGRQRLDAALAGSAAAPPPARRRALLAAGELALLSCDYAAAERLLEESAASARADGDARSLAAAEQTLGSVARERGAYTLAEERHARSRAAWRRLGDRREEARAVNYLAFVAWIGGGDRARAAALAAEALRAFDEIGDGEGRVWARLNLGAAAHHGGDPASAARHLEAAFHDAALLRYQEGIAWSLHLLGVVALGRGEATRARAQLRASLRLHRAVGDLWRAASVLESLAVAAADRQRAGFLLGAARAVRQRIGVPVPEAERAAVEALAVDAAACARGGAATLDAAMGVALEE